MANYRGEKKSGKVGDVIYSSWHGRPYVRRRPEKVANPQTEAQQNHRNAFAEISRLSSAMKEAHTKGLHWHAVRQKLNTHSVFKSLNKDCYGPDEREGHFAHPMERAVGMVDAQIPEQWLGHDLHLYAFMRDAKGRTSETIYISMPTTRA